MPTQIQSGDISQNAVRFVTEEVMSSGSAIRNLNITNNPIGFTNTLAHITITPLTAGMTPYGITEYSGNIYTGESSVIRIISGNTINIFAGRYNVFSPLGDGGPAISGTFASARDLCFDASGNSYIADTGNYRIRKINVNGIISTFAGDGNTSFDGGGNGGPAISGSFSNSIGDVACTNDGVVYVADVNGSQVRRIQNGVIDIAAGSGVSGVYPGDGYPAVGVYSIANPCSVCVDNSTNSFYFVNMGGQLVIKVDASGLMTKIAGLDNDPGYNGDNIPASGAQLYYPYKCRLDPSGNLYVAEGQNGINIRIRKIDTNGIITTYAGNGTPGYSGDGGPASGASFWFQTGIGGDAFTLTLESEGITAYINESVNGRIRIVNPSGIVNTFAGYGNTTFTNGEYLVNSSYVPSAFIGESIESISGLARYTNLSGTNVQANLSYLTGFSPLSVDKFFISYTTNE